MRDVGLFQHAAPAEVRRATREGAWTASSRGLALGHVQAGLVIVPRQYRADLLEFCYRNPRACPVIEALEPGQFEPIAVAPGADIRTDLVRYRITTPGRSWDVPDLVHLWDDSLCAVLIGCSYTFEGALQSVGIEVPGLEENLGNPLFRTSVATESAGPFGGPLVVSMRAFPSEVVDEVVRITKPIELGHGAPIHIGNPQALGIEDLMKPDWGKPRPLRTGEQPLFWACSITAPEAARRAGVPWFVTHVPSYMFVTDISVPT